jgi:uncharacterized membrane protein YvbJ
MKSCSYCGKQYPDDFVTCPIDGTSLGNSDGMNQKIKISAQKRTCPACGAVEDYSSAIELRSSFSWPIFFVGGLLAVMFRNAGREKRVRCNKCEQLFNIRTPISKLSRAVFWILVCPAILTLITFLIVLIAGIVSH